MSICLVVGIGRFSRLNHSCGYRKRIVSSWWWSDMFCLGNEASSATGLDALTTINPIDSLYTFCLLWHWLQSYCLSLWKVAFSPVPPQKHLCVFWPMSLSAQLSTQALYCFTISWVSRHTQHVSGGFSPTSTQLFKHMEPQLLPFPLKGQGRVNNLRGNSEVTGSAVLLKRINEAKHLTLPGSTSLTTNNNSELQYRERQQLNTYDIPRLNAYVGRHTCERQHHGWHRWFNVIKSLLSFTPGPRQPLYRVV